VKIEKEEETFDKRLAEMGIRIKDADAVKVSENVFDEVTLLALYKLVHKKWLSAIGWFYQHRERSKYFPRRIGETGAVAIKIYRIQSANFTTMSFLYSFGDRRFYERQESKKGAHLCLDKEGVCKPCPGKRGRTARAGTARL